MNRPILHLTTAVLIGFALLVLATTYHQIIAGPGYRDDPRNVRVAEGRAGRERGGIIAAGGEVLAQSVPNPETNLFSRDYPYDGLYAHTVGYSTRLFGDTGIEQTRATELASGQDSSVSGILIALTGGDLRPKGVRLTINHGLQTAAAEALGDQAGSVVALDPTTGAILAVVSNPTFDPNLLVPRDAGPVGDVLSDDPSLPLLNRALNQLYPPGSTFKIVTAAAALEAGIAGPETMFPDLEELALPGSTATIRNANRQRCSTGTDVSLATALIRSCNTVFGLIGLELGAAEIVGRAEAFGFNEIPPFELETTAAQFPQAAAFINDEPGLAQSSIGQRDVRATPLQMALIAAAVANNGEIMTPHIVAEIFDADGEVKDTLDPSVWRRAMSPASAASLGELMVEVVTRGTGRAAAVPGVVVGGKTGTAEVPDANPHAWFIGFAEIEGRWIAMAVLVENGGNVGADASGGSVAAPIARAVIEAFASGSS